MSLDTNGIDSMEQNQLQMPCYSETYQKQHYLPDTSTAEHPEYEAVSSTSHFDMGLEFDKSGRFIETDPNMYPILDSEAYVTQMGVGITEDNINKPKSFVRPTVTREFVSTSGEKFVLSHLVQQPSNGRTNEGVKKRKRTRTAFTDNQIKKLEDEYAANRYLDQPRRQHIAKSLSLFERTVKIWFQNRRMKEKKMIREANEQSGDEESHRESFRHEYYTVPTGAFSNSQLSTSYEVPQISNCTTPNHSYGYGMCPPTYSEAVSLYPTNTQHYSVILPNSSNIVNTGYYKNQLGFGTPVPNVYSNQNESLRAGTSVPNVYPTQNGSLGTSTSVPNVYPTQNGSLGTSTSVPNVYPTQNGSLGTSTSVPNVYSTQSESLRAAMSTLNVDDTEGASNIVIEKHSPLSFLTDEEVTNEVTCSQTLVKEEIPDVEIAKNDYMNLDTFLQ